MPSQESDIWVMLTECCSWGESNVNTIVFIAHNLCWRNRESYQGIFEHFSKKQVALIHQLDNNKLRNVAEFCGQILEPFGGQRCGFIEQCFITHQATTPSSRLFNNVLHEKVKELMQLDEFTLENLPQQQHALHHRETSKGRFGEFQWLKHFQECQDQHQTFMLDLDSSDGNLGSSVHVNSGSDKVEGS